MLQSIINRTRRIAVDQAGSLRQRLARIALDRGILHRPSFANLGAPIRLYAGNLNPGLPQYQTHFGLAINPRSPRDIPHDCARPIPLPDNSVAVFQSEDVFEHLPLEKMPSLLNDIHRVLEPGGLLRLSLPDYRGPILRARSVIDSTGEILFDPGGGGKYMEGRVVDGGHLWFPEIGIVRQLFEDSRFETARTHFLHYNADDGSSITHPIDYSHGHIQRTPDHDSRTKVSGDALSIVVDARK